jgi:glycosyltransferase involved in cell wall biosynthesis
MKAAIVIPAYNEAATIEKVVRQVLDAGLVIVVDDNSSDKTASLARDAGAIVVTNTVNLGYEGAINQGFIEANKHNIDIVVTFDADGQHDPHSLPEIFKVFEDQKVDICIGVRKHSARLGEWVFNLYFKYRFGVADMLCGLKAYRMSLYQRYGCFDHLSLIGTELALRALYDGVMFKTVDVSISSRLDEPRFGSSWRANIRLLQALFRARLLGKS